MTQNKEIVIGDVVKWENPHEYCRIRKRVSRLLTATVPLVCGEICEPDGAVAQIATWAAVTAPLADAGTYRLGYKGQWTAALAFDLIFADIKTAFEALSTVTDTITFAAAGVETYFITGSTATWATAGHKSEIEVDPRLLTDGGVVMTGTNCGVTTIGSAATDMVVIAAGGNASGILLESITLDEYKNDNNLWRSFLVRGASIVDSDNLTVLAAQKATALAALVALGIVMRTEPDIYQSGSPIA